MPGKNRKRPRTDDATDQRTSHSSQSAKPQPTSTHHPQQISAFVAIRAQQNESASDTRRLPRRDGPAEQLGADDDWSDRGDGSQDEDDPGVGARPTARSSLESWKKLIDARPNAGSFTAVGAGERVRLDSGQKLCVAGQFYLRVFVGEVWICGSRLGPETPAQRVIAPSTEHLPVISASVDGTEVEISNVDEYEDYETLGGVSPLFRGIWATEVSSEPKRTYHVVSDSRQAYVHRVAHMDELSGWDDTINSLIQEVSRKNRAVFICGAATSGKGIFARLLMNSWIRAKENDVAFLDLDPSRPETSLPDHISLTLSRQPLFMPSFGRQNPQFRQNRIICHAVGANSPRTDANHYLQCVQTLLENAPEGSHQIICGPDIPLQSGGRLFGALLSIIGATDVVFMSKKTKDTFKAAISSPTTRYHLDSQNVMQLPRPQVEEHKRSLQAYFHSSKKLRPAPLKNQIPYELSYEEGGAGFVGVLVPGELTCMPPNWLSTLLNGSIVTIIVLAEDYPLNDRATKRSEPEGIPYFLANDDGEVESLDPHHSRSAGLGLVRGIDAAGKQLHVITPELLGKLPRGRIVLELGGYDATWAYTEDVRPGADAPYVESGTARRQ